MLRYAVYKTNIGNIKLTYENDYITNITTIINENCGEGEKTNFTNNVHEQLVQYLKGERFEFDFPYKLEGTEFQMKVWNELIKIPYGETKTYGEIAKLIGNEKAQRAVGNANNKNPIGIVVPCHRVIGSNGKLVGYAGGLNMKEALLNMENKFKSK